MSKVLGIGGVFVKSKDPDRLRAWYRDVLGMELQSWGAAMLFNEPGSFAQWSAFGADTKYLEPSSREFMINLRVDDADAMAAQARERGGNVLDRREKDENGTFCYVVDPDGTLIELWSSP
jgi:catechol 2,3-dioxygenase-like lactoylglutathione lyase family enzyme